MRNTYWGIATLVAAAFTSIGSTENSAQAATNTRTTNPTAIAVELAGRGLMYSVTLDRVLSEDFAAGFGIGAVGMQSLAGVDAGVNATLIPAYINYYLLRDAGSVFLTGGVNLVTNSSSVKDMKSSSGGLEFSSSPIQFTFGAGFEYRSDAGYLLRLTGYGLSAGKNIAPWAGVTLGYSF